MQIDFSGKIVLLTGASSGIGEATARRLAECGARLMLTGRSEAKLATLAGEIAATGGEAAILAGDITDSAFRERLVGDTVTRFGQLDVLVNNAGIIDTGTVETTAMDAWHRMMDINLHAMFHLMQLAIPHLEKTRGNIVNISSVAGTRSFPGILAYCVSEAGADQLTRCAALELAGKGIRVNAVNPGVVVTRLHTREVMDEEAYANFIEHSKSTHPLGRVGEPEEIADLIAFIASDRAGWITGATHAIDGGRAQTCAR